MCTQPQLAKAWEGEIQTLVLIHRQHWTCSKPTVEVCVWIYIFFLLCFIMHSPHNRKKKKKKKKSNLNNLHKTIPRSEDDKDSWVRFFTQCSRMEGWTSFLQVLKALACHFHNKPQKSRDLPSMCKVGNCNLSAGVGTGWSLGSFPTQSILRDSMICQASCPGHKFPAAKLLTHPSHSCELLLTLGSTEAHIPRWANRSTPVFTQPGKTTSSQRISYFWIKIGFNKLNSI